MMRGPVRHAPLVTQVADQFRELITSGRWAIGQKIPGEHELAAELNVSRATVREALRGLSITGLLEPRIGDGTYVRATNEITGVLVRDDLSTLDHVLDARGGLEAVSARLAAQQATPTALHELAVSLEARTRAHDSGDLIAYAKADSAFHRAVIHASGNPVLVRLHTAVAELMDQSIEQTSVLPEDPEVGNAHARLLRAIQDRDPDGAASAAYELIALVKSTAPAPSEVRFP
ncbi:FadR/GntR family transcriptional regulator [Dactylosporangium sp. NPDC048998]|uniref:FadR/GntR family transcriptional regulator n=1 Tax=Dactylosporangium sp. NPDC048998 TaxID=3363976 RepID=UPI0037204AD8